jgi:hypothetical protein
MKLREMIGTEEYDRVITMEEVEEVGEGEMEEDEEREKEEEESEGLDDPFFMDPSEDSSI